MVDYIKENLQNDEEVKMIAVVNMGALIFPAIILVIYLILVISFIGSQYLYVVLMLCQIWFIYSIYTIVNVLMAKYRSILAFTNKRIIAKFGLINIRNFATPLDKINDFYIKQSLIGRIVGYSSIVIKSNTTSYVYRYVRNANKFKDLMTTTDRVRKVEVDKKEMVFNSKSDKFEDLKKLKELYDSDVLTKEEFEREKKKLLD